MHTEGFGSRRMCGLTCVRNSRARSARVTFVMLTPRNDERVLVGKNLHSWDESLTEAPRVSTSLCKQQVCVCCAMVHGALQC